MTDAPASGHVAAAQFLAMLAGDDLGGFLELRFRLHDGERMGRVFESTSRARSLAARAITLGRRTDVYVGCAPRARRAGSADAVQHAFVLWVDCDGPAATAALESFEPPPPVLVASGTGTNRHAYWPLNAPLRAQQLADANRRLVAALGADLTCVDPARILRIPGTLSHKHAPPAPVTALRLDTERRYTPSQVVGHLPEPGPTRTSPTGRVAPGRPTDPLLSIPPDVYVARLLQTDIPRHRKVTCPFHSDRHPSLHVYDTPERGWYCFGRCRRGGTIYDLAAPLYGLAAEGADFLRLRAQLQRLFLNEAE